MYIYIYVYSSSIFPSKIHYQTVLQRIVKDGETLSFGSLSGVVSENETVVLLLDVAGGMRAKWRKKRMRRLRRKRRKMRQRAR